MKLLAEIVAALSSEQGSLTDALLKTKVLLHRIGRQELADWVNSELNGYADPDSVPEYRRLPAQVLVNAMNMAYQVNSHPIPLGHLTDKQREDLQTAKMHQSLAVLEDFAKSKKGRLQAPIPMEANGLLGQGLANGYKIQRAWCDIQTADVGQIVIQVRSRLLDFILQMQDHLGENAADDEVKVKSQSIDAAGLFQSAIFGDNTTIVVGNHNTQTVTNTNVKGDFIALSELLCKHGVSDEDIEGLKQAVDDDEGSPELDERRFGPKVRQWMSGMLSKVVEASWQIELGVAGSLLASAIQRYYGWP